MSRQPSPHHPLFRRPPSSGTDRLAPVVLGALTLALAAMIYTLPHDIVLPVFAIAAIAGAAIVALAALVAPRFAAMKPIGPWDIAGALTLIGCAAAILGEIEPLIEYLKPEPSSQNLPEPERSPSRV